MKNNKPERNIQSEILLALSEQGAVVFRNNVGVNHTKDGRFIRYGVGGNGGSDIIGLYKGRFLAVEVKTATGPTSKEQKAFISMVVSHGGIAGIARSVDDALELLADKY